MSKATAYGLYALLVVIWSSTWVAIKIGLEDCPPLLGAGVRIYEVPVEYRARSREEGKKLTALDGVRVLRTLVRCRLTP